MGGHSLFYSLSNIELHIINSSGSSINMGPLCAPCLTSLGGVRPRVGVYVGGFRCTPIRDNGGMNAMCCLCSKEMLSRIPVIASRNTRCVSSSRGVRGGSLPRGVGGFFEGIF